MRAALMSVDPLLFFEEEEEAGNISTRLLMRDALEDICFVYNWKDMKHKAIKRGTMEMVLGMRNAVTKIKRVDLQKLPKNTMSVDLYIPLNTPGIFSLELNESFVDSFKIDEKSFVLTSLQDPLGTQVNLFKDLRKVRRLNTQFIQLTQERPIQSFSFEYSTEFGTSTLIFITIRANVGMRQYPLELEWQMLALPDSLHEQCDTVVPLTETICGGVQIEQEPPQQEDAGSVEVPEDNSVDVLSFFMITPDYMSVGKRQNNFDDKEEFKKLKTED